MTNAKLADNQIGASVPDTLQIVTNSVFYGKTTNNPDEVGFIILFYIQLKSYYYLK